jgi:Flp pilus assembly protein TadG
MRETDQGTVRMRKLQVKCFLRDQSGTATIEAILWIPVFFFMLLLVMEASLVFNKQSMAMRIVQDINRGVAVGRLENEQTATAALTRNIRSLSPNATANTVIDNGLVVSSVQMPIRDLSGFGFFGKTTNFTVSAGSQQLLEQ